MELRLLRYFLTVAKEQARTAQLQRPVDIALAHQNIGLGNGTGQR